MTLAFMIIGGIPLVGAFYACCVVASRADESYYKHKYREDGKDEEKP